MSSRQALFFSNRRSTVLVSRVALSLVTAGSFMPAASAAVLISDNFTVTTSTNDPNSDLTPARQSGPLFPFAYTTLGNNHQVGNTATDVGQPGGVANGNYLLLASDSAVQTSVQIGASLAKGAPITIKFDMYNTGTAGDQTADLWGAVTLRPAGDAWPVAPDNAFGMLKRRNGGAQAFQSGGGIAAFNNIADVAGFFPSPHFELTFTDTAKTGSAFAGNGSTVLIVNGSSPAVEVPLAQNLSPAGLVLGFRNYGGQVLGIDNLEINGVASLPGDANADGFVNIADFNLISDNFLTTQTVPGTNGDLNLDGVVDQKDFRAWRVATGANAEVASGAVPEPGSLFLSGMAAVAIGVVVKRARS